VGLGGSLSPAKTKATPTETHTQHRLQEKEANLFYTVISAKPVSLIPGICSGYHSRKQENGA